jgi:ABC-type nickel/cobalt efflux system permease component RcnA
VLLVAGACIALPLLALWATGSLGEIALWAAEAQRQAQNALAGAVRRLRAGETGALAGLMALAFAYGVAHAAGPGHGKVLIGGYGVARRVALGRLAAVALAASLAQAAVAVALVYAGIGVLALSREALVGLAEGPLLLAGHLAVAGVGLWLAWRGLAGLWRALGREAPAGHAHHGDHAHGSAGEACETCGHAHGPSPAAVEAATGWPAVLALVAGIAIRPCTGALLLLVLTWQMGIGAAGIAGTFAMGLGTGLVTVAVAALAVWSRAGLGAALQDGRFRVVGPAIELAAGAAIAAIAVTAAAAP